MLSIPLIPLSYLITFVQVILGLAACLLAAYLYFWPWREYRLTYHNLPGPAPAHWWLGNIPDIIYLETGIAFERWIGTYGHTLRHKSIAGIPEILTVDPVALSHILSAPDLFIKPAKIRQGVEALLGTGLVTAEGEAHRRQRKALTPAFGPRVIKEMLPMFYDKAYELKDKFEKMIEDPSIESCPTPPKGEDTDIKAGGRKIDTMKYIMEATLDIIGLAGFGHKFDALSGPENELARAWQIMLHEVSTSTVSEVILDMLGASWMPTRKMKAMWKSRVVIDRIGKGLTIEKKAALTQDGGVVEKSRDVGKDVLSLLIKANMATDLPPQQRLSDEEVRCQISTMLFAGNETSTTAITWSTFVLAKYPDVQAKLREEIREVPDDRPSMETLSSMPYLDAFLREVLRLYPPFPLIFRETTKDAIVPFASPVKGRNGVSMTEVLISKGTQIDIPIGVINRSANIYGPDAGEFKPERHLPSLNPKFEARIKLYPILWGNSFSFSGGPRNCIGYRLAVAEIKSILFVLLRNLSFEELPSKPKIVKVTAVIMRPMVKGEFKVGLQMPLLVKTLE